MIVPFIFSGRLQPHGVGVGVDDGPAPQKTALTVSKCRGPGRSRRRVGLPGRRGANSVAGSRKLIDQMSRMLTVCPW